MTDADLENAINVQDSLIHKLDCCKADIFIHKKNLEKVKAKQKRCSTINKEMTIEIDRLHAANYKIDIELRRLEERRLNRNINTENSVDTVFAENIENEMSLFEDRVILGQIKNHEIKLEKEKADELEKRKKALEQRKQKEKDEELKKKKKRQISLKSEIEKKRNEMSKLMAKMEVSQPEKILNKLSETHGTKDGLLDLVEHYHIELERLKTEVEQLKEDKKMLNLQDDREAQDDMREFARQKSLAEESGDFKMANKIERCELEVTKLKQTLYDDENKYKRMSKILNDSCTTVSRIMYQLQSFQKEKNVEVTNGNVVEFLSHLGLKLERMLAFIHTKNKVVRDEEIDEDDIFEIQEGIGARISRPPDWLGINPKRVSLDDNRIQISAVPDYEIDENDEQSVYFENLRNKSRIVDQDLVAETKKKKQVQIYG